MLDTKLRCDCGHEGEIHMKENDQPFSAQWESYSLRNLNGGRFYTEKFVTRDEVFKQLRPTCPECGLHLTPSHAVK
jgi:hypothetical protein